MRHRHVLVSTVSFYLQEVSPLGWPCSDGEVNEKKRARLEKVRSGVPYMVQATTDIHHTTSLPLVQRWCRTKAAAMFGLMHQLVCSTTLGAQPPAVDDGSVSSRQRLGAIDTAMILHDEFWRLALYTHTEHPTEALFGIMCHLARCSKWATSRLVQYVMEGVSDCVVDAYGPYVAAAVALARLGGPQDTDKRPDADPSAPEMPLFEGRGRALALGMMRVVQAQQEFHKEMAEGVLCLVQMCGVSLVSVCVRARHALRCLTLPAPLSFH